MLNTGIQDFIQKNINADISSVALQKWSFNGVTKQEVLEQLESKQKCKNKLPTWFSKSNIYYPPKLSIEQTSSEATAQFKAALVSGKSLLDATGGFGVDSYYFSNQFSEVIYCEANLHLAEIAEHNFNVLGVKNVSCIKQNSLEYLKNTSSNFDVIYIDPSRRSKTKERVFLLEDCEPDVLANTTIFLKKATKVIIKTAPLLDIKEGINKLKHVESVYVIALKNEVKELLWILSNNTPEHVTIHAVQLQQNATPKTFAFTLLNEAQYTPEYSQPQTYLYEPNAAILKAGAFNSIAISYKLNKLHKHSHLYTSNIIQTDFPGRIFKILDVLEYKKKNLKQLPKQANITTRNFPERADVLKKKLKIKDGGSNYLFFTTNANNQKIVVICQKA